MWFYQLTILTLCVLNTLSLDHQTGIQNSGSSEDQLIFAHVIFRHGDRNIIGKFPNDPYKDESHWPGGMGELSNEGKRQQFRLGQYLRRRYNELIGEKYSPEKVYIRSTDFDRTIMSALANLAGLYQPTSSEVWNELIPTWQPIPVHVAELKSDYTLYGPGKNCPKFEVGFNKYLEESPDVQRILNKYRAWFSYWSKMCGSEIKTIGDVSLLYNTLCIENWHNKSLADWAEKAIEPNGIMQSIADFAPQMKAGTPELARLRSGFLIKEMLERFTQKINSTLTPDRSLWIYSAHDTTITCFFKALGLLKFHHPQYASSLHLELYKTRTNEHYFQIFYRNANEEHLIPMNIPKCGEKCSIDRFYTKHAEVIPGDFETECKLE